MLNLIDKYNADILSKILNGTRSNSHVNRTSLRAKSYFNFNYIFIYN